jgi:hypothetical protein
MSSDPFQFQKYDYNTSDDDSPHETTFAEIDKLCNGLRKQRADLLELKAMLGQSGDAFDEWKRKQRKKRHSDMEMAVDYSSVVDRMTLEQLRQSQHLAGTLQDLAGALVELIVESTSFAE